MQRLTAKARPISESPITTGRASAGEVTDIALGRVDRNARGRLLRVPRPGRKAGAASPSALKPLACVNLSGTLAYRAATGAMGVLGRDGVYHLPDSELVTLMTTCALGAMGEPDLVHDDRSCRVLSSRGICGRIVMGRRLSPLYEPLDWPRSRPLRSMSFEGALAMFCGATIAECGLFLSGAALPAGATRRRGPSSVGQPKESRARGERRPLRPRVVPQHPVGVGPSGGVAPPSQNNARVDHGYDTRRCQLAPRFVLAPCSTCDDSSLRRESVRACSAASRLRSLRSPLRDLDSASARPTAAVIGASREPTWSKHHSTRGCP